MTFICPICNVESSKKKPNHIKPVKKGKTWRDRQKERVAMPTVELGFICPCCKERRSMKQYNPFEQWKKHVPNKRNMSKFNSGKRSPSISPHLSGRLLEQSHATLPTSSHRASVKVHSLNESQSAQNIQTLSKTNPIGDARQPDRTYMGEMARVSWDDDAELRRQELISLVSAALRRHVVLIQAAIRRWRAMVRVRKMRSKKKKQLLDSPLKQKSQQRSKIFEEPI